MRHWCRDQDTSEELQKMGEDLKRLIRVRGAYRGHCTRPVKAANEIMNSYSPDLDALEDVFEGLCSRMEQLLLQNQKIELAVSEDKIEEEISQTLEYTDDLTGQKEWDSNADTMSFPLLRVVSETKALHGQLTKRRVLSIAAKVFDPLGLLEPFTVRAKMMLQELWTR